MKKKEKIFFSIIVPIYNVEKYLDECLKSILSQSYRNFEVICINDASTDNSYVILSKYADRYSQIKLISNEMNEGLSYSRNRGMEIAEGDYIIFVDSDDYVSEKMLSVLEGVLGKNPADILNFNYDLKLEGINAAEKNFYINARYTTDLSYKTGQEWFSSALNNDFPITPYAWNKVYKRTFLIQEKLKFYEGLLHEDILFLVQSVMKAERVIFIEDSLYIYRRRDGSITAGKSEKKLDSLVIIVSEIWSVWKSNQLEAGMDEALKKYMDKWMAVIRTLIMCFPEHKELEMGKPEDQFLFSLMQTPGKEHIMQYVHFNQDEWNIIKKFDKHIIIYGAGTVGAELILYLEKRGIDIFGVAVSDKSVNTSQIAGYQIRQISELIEYRNKALVIVAIVKRNQKSVYQKLVDLGFENILLLDTDRKE